LANIEPHLEGVLPEIKVKMALPTEIFSDSKISITFRRIVFVGEIRIGLVPMIKIQEG
jgi:hypothetical protein